MRKLLLLLGVALLFAASYQGVYYGLEYLQAKGLLPENRERVVYDWVIRHGTIVDGTGKEPMEADLGIRQGRIVFIGKIEPPRGVKTIDATGKLVLPGFIDFNPSLGQPTREEAGALVSQGITTLVTGYAGEAGPVEHYLRKAALERLDLNYGVVAAAGALLSPGEDRVSSLEPRAEAPVAQGAFGILLDRETQAGAGFTSEELKKIARGVARTGGSLVVGLGERAAGELKDFLALATAEKVKLHLLPFRWEGTGEDILLWLQQAQKQGAVLTAGFYPPGTVGFSLPRPLTGAYPKHRADTILIEAGPLYLRPWLGKTLSQVAAAKGIDPGTMANQLISSGEVLVRIALAPSPLLERLLQEPFGLAATGETLGDDQKAPVGTYPRLLGEYVRERSLLSWAGAAQKLAAQPAQVLGLTDRGIIRKEAWADLVILDPLTVGQEGGIEYVLVNGQGVVLEGKYQPKKAGQVLYYGSDAGAN